tara:strand:+ start:54 stop:443 length:390 start_codon:yes stop_codon:yes gene_type:complete
MQKLSKKQVILLILVTISIALAIYIFTITKNTYLKCNTKNEKVFYMKIDRPHFAFIHDNPYFIDGDWYTMFNEIYSTKLDIVIRDKDETLGDQFFYDSMSLSRYSLSLQAYGHGNIGNCIEIKKAKQKL